MGVLTCPACGHKVSEHADCCPECGCKISFIKKAPINKDIDRTGYLEDAQNGDADAMANYSNCLEFGTDCDVDLQKSFYWAKKAYEEEDPFGCYRYAHLILEKGISENNFSQADNFKNAIKAALKGVTLNSTACMSLLAEVFSHNYYFSNDFLAGYYMMMLKAAPFIEDEDLEDDREDWESDDFSYCNNRVEDELKNIYSKIDSFFALGSDYDRASKFAKDVLKIKPGTYGNSNSISFKEVLNNLKKLPRKELTENFIKYLFDDIIFSKKLTLTNITFTLDKTPEEKLLDKIFNEIEYIQTEEEAFEILKKAIDKSKDLYRLELDYKYSIPFLGRAEKSTHIYGIMQEAKKAVSKNDEKFLSKLSKEQKEVLGRYTRYEIY